jgi:hypothetical protein
MKDQKQSQESFYNEWLNDFVKKFDHMPTKEDIKIFKKEHRKTYLKKYYRENKNKKDFLKITLTKEEAEKLKKVCQKYGKKKATLGKQIILNFIENKNTLTDTAEKTLQSATLQIRKAGTNINQLTKYEHQNKGSIIQSTHEQILEILLNLEVDLRDFILKKNDN